MMWQHAKFILESVEKKGYLNLIRNSNINWIFDVLYLQQLHPAFIYLYVFYVKDESLILLNTRGQV